MTDKPEFFTRETWRPSKKRKMRKRVKPWGGRKTAPPELLEAGKRTQFKPGHQGARICTATKRDGTPCRMVALKGLKTCGAHGGFGIWAQQGILQPTGKKAAIRAAAVEGQSKSPPMELLSLQAYRNANNWTRMRLIRAWQTPAWNAVIRACV